MPNDTPQSQPAFQLTAKQGQEPPEWNTLSGALWTKDASTGPTQTMLTNDGKQTLEVAFEHVTDAVKAGYHLAHEMIAPDGQKGLVPYHRVADALEAGFKHAK